MADQQRSKAAKILEQTQKNFIKMYPKMTDLVKYAILSIEIRVCPEIDRDRKRGNKRAFAHTGHVVNKNYICVSKYINTLCDTKIAGIILHEVGHIFTGCGSEPEADKWVKEILGITIRYPGSDPLQLQTIHHRTYKKYYGRKKR